MKIKTKIFSRKKILFACIFAGIYGQAIAENRVLDNNLVFDENMFRGSGITPDIIESLSKDSVIIPGKYDNSKIIVNGYSVGEATVTVKKIDNKNIICMSGDILEQAGFRDEYINIFNEIKKSKPCISISDIDRNFTANMESDLALSFIVPQAGLRGTDGAIKESKLNRGESVLFSNYIFNYFHNKTTGNDSSDSDYVYLNLNSGFNIGLWQFRQLSSANYSSYRRKKSNTSNSSWYNISTYVQRPIYALKSNLIMGKTNTTGQFFGGLSYIGAELSSDERMYPSSEQGYAPAITGIAKTNALVEVRQNNNLIYQTTVPPGNFDIRNLNSTSYNGDLDVTVIEADGSKSSFVVPFSAVPDSVRPGKIKYSVAGGKTRDLVVDKTFVDSAIQYGLNNIMTIGGGLRASNAYRATTVSTVFATSIGAIGINGTYSNANLGGKYGTKQGWMSNITYSKTIQATNTNIALAGYKYSTAGYREFTDFIYEQHYVQTGKISGWGTRSYQQKYRLSASVFQPLGSFGNLGLSASMQEYHDGRSRDVTYQANYSRAIFSWANMNISVSRQKYGNFYNSFNGSSRNETLTMVSLDIPLGNMGSSVSNSVYFDKNNGNQYQTGLSGTVGDQNSPYSYNMSINHSEQGNLTSYAGNLNKQTSLASISANAAKGKNYTQLGIGATGAVVLHSGGLLLGPYVGDTFGIVEAKGATGAEVYNGQGARVNSGGYALVPSLTAYRYNSIGLTSDGMKNNNVDIESSEQRVAPYAGTVVKVKFNTKQGYPILLRLMTKNNISIPIGSTISNSSSPNLGLVGQNNQAYFRAEDMQGDIKITWGNRSDEQCSAHYRVDEKLINASLIKLSAQCI